MSHGGTLFEASGSDWTVNVEQRQTGWQQVAPGRRNPTHSVDLEVSCNGGSWYDVESATLTPDDADLFAAALQEAARVVRGQPMEETA